MKFRPRVRTKNFSCEYLRPQNKNLKKFPIRSLIRLGSLTPPNQIFDKGTSYVEINSIDAINTSRDKLKMKEAFKTFEIPQAEWWIPSQLTEEVLPTLPYPLIAKRINGFKGKGMKKLDTIDSLREFMNNTSLAGYYFEKFYNYAREYRIHATQEEVILRWRKLRREDAEERWYFNSDNCNWIGETNELFQLSGDLLDRVDEAAKKAVIATGLDIGAVDVRIQSNNMKVPSFIVLEVNSAPRMGETSNKIYAEKIENIIEQKINGNRLHTA